jgi:long-chain acyl-CoA synthetase
MPESHPRPPVARLGCTLPQLIFEAHSRYGSYPALHRFTGEEWETTTSDELITRAGHIAVGLVARGLATGDRVAFYMHSDSEFVTIDFGCLIAGIVDVPIYLSQASEAIHFVLEHSEARMLFVSDAELLEEVTASLAGLPNLETIVVTDGPPTPTEGLEVISLSQLESTGAGIAREDPLAARRLADQRYPDDLATVIYTSGTTGQPKGVMLSHENLSSNALYTYQETEIYRAGPEGETVLSFLPLSHVFARTLGYASMAFGSPIWFSRPDRIVQDFQTVRPTIFAAVPRVLEKVYAGIVERSNETRGVKGKLARWALARAQNYETGQSLSGLEAVRHRTADRLVYSKWRAALGGRISIISCGGAALNAEVTDVFSAAGMHVLQGYGLTETSPVITFNRPSTNRAGWVGTPLPHVEVKIAADGEICTKGPHVMMGYLRDPNKTAEVIDQDGWFHTGDIGEFQDNFLRITDRKKDLFKLSTGKYVMPQPLENKLTAQPLVEQAVVIGAGRKFTTALVFPNQEAVRKLAGRARGTADRATSETDAMEELVCRAEVLEAFQKLVVKANQGMDYWISIKRFRLVPDHVSVENGLLTPTLKIKRALVRDRFANEIAGMYEDAECKPPVVIIEPPI